MHVNVLNLQDYKGLSLAALIAIAGIAAALHGKRFAVANPEERPLFLKVYIEPGDEDNVLQELRGVGFEVESAPEALS